MSTQSMGVIVCLVLTIMIERGHLLPVQVSGELPECLVTDSGTIFGQLWIEEMSKNENLSCPRNGAILIPEDQELQSLLPGQATVDNLVKSSILRRELLQNHILFDPVNMDGRNVQHLRTLKGSKIEVSNNNGQLSANGRFFKALNKTSQNHCNCQIFLLEGVVGISQYEFEAILDQSSEVPLKLPVLTDKVKFMLEKNLSGATFSQMWQHLLDLPTTQRLEDNIELFIVVPSDAVLKEQFDKETNPFIHDEGLMQRIVTNHISVGGKVPIQPLTGWGEHETIERVSLSGKELAYTRMMDKMGDTAFTINGFWTRRHFETDTASVFQIETILFSSKLLLEKITNDLNKNSNRSSRESQMGQGHIFSSHFKTAFIPELSQTLEDSLHQQGADKFIEVWKHSKLVSGPPILPSKSSDVCFKSPERMSPRAIACVHNVPMWTYKPEKNRCIPHFYARCNDQVNLFNTEEECLATCQTEKEPLTVYAMNDDAFEKFLHDTSTSMNMILQNSDLEKMIILNSLSYDPPCNEGQGFQSSLNPDYQLPCHEVQSSSSEVLKTLTFRLFIVTEALPSITEKVIQAIM